MNADNKKKISETIKSLGENIANAIKPIINIAKDFEEAINPKKEYLVINRKNEECISLNGISATYYYYTWSELVDLINSEGKDNLIIFKIEDAVVIQNEISIIEEAGENK